MRFLMRIFLILLPILLNSPTNGFSADFLRPVLRIGFTSSENSIWQDSRLHYQGPTYDFTEALATYLNRKATYTSGTLEENLQRLRSGSIDAIILPDIPMTAAITEPRPDYLPPGTIAVPLGAGMGWLLLDENRTELQPDLTAAVQTINLVNPFFRYDLLEKYHETGLELNLTPEEKAFLAAHPVVRTMISPRQAPYSYFDQEHPAGVIAEIIKRVEKDLGITLEVIPEETQHTMMAHLTNGDIDMVMDFNTDYNWAKAHNADLTFPYLTLNYVSVLRKDSPLPEKPVVACARTHFYTQQFIEKNFPPEQLRYYADVADCMDAVNKGEADMTFVKAITAQSDIFQGNYYNLYTNGNAAFSHQVSMAVRNTMDPIFIRILNKEVAHIHPRDISSIINSEVYQIQGKDSLQSFIYRNPIFTLALSMGILLLIILVLLYFLWLRHKYTAALWQQANVVKGLGLYNLQWFTNELPNAIAYYQEARKSGELFVLIISPQRQSFLKEVYGAELFAETTKNSLQDVVQKLPWILRYGLSSEITHIYMLCQKPKGLTLRQAAEQVEKNFRVINVNGVLTSFTYHIGVCPVPRTKDIDASLLMGNAMMARNEIIGQNHVIGVFNSVMHDELLKHQQMELYMEKALAAGEFKIYLQAKYDLETREICGAEALIRWQSPELGFLVPSHFITLFERNGFVLKLDYFVLEQISKLLAERLKQKLPVVPISINQSGLHVSERGYLANMQAIAERYQLPRKLIELELTETSFIDFTTKKENENAVQITRRLKSMGFSLSMDDFCTGYSSIAMLRNLPMDIMKIDRSMLQSAENSERCLTILKQVIKMGRNLNMRVLVEGIETTAQERLLKAIGCQIGQGFLFAHPVPLEQFFAELEKN
ncbi:MAG: EAL domain-containing protein [Selenomonas sp.]|uniref:EAL domain-containing protein n=1 Tax=Selenomonas sp. TaxID=2053611 RepID=UPI0025EDF4A0|nr:EAL domain-containing protein [Selenomonas sp.]MCR5757376.1 EAL domain-containing protein [Selenomonas sp.]